MESNNNKAKLPIASNSIHNFPKKYPHITTSSFMQFNIATAMEMPKSDLSCVHKSYLRTFALKRPLYSNVTIKKQAYFVPYRVIWPCFTDFREDVPHNTPDGTTILSNTPLISLMDLVGLFQTSDYSTRTSTAPSDLKHGCDFTCTDPNSAVQRYYTFTDFGRWAYKLLTSMGLRLPFADFHNLTKDDTIDALPLLAVVKVYLDYFFPNQYAHYGTYAFLDGIMQRHFIYTLTSSELDAIFKALATIAYNDDYFVSAFDNPVMSANGVQSTDFRITDISLSNTGLSDVQQSVVVQASNGTPIAVRKHGDNSNSPHLVASFSQYVDSHLKALTNYIKRHSLAGSRSLTRYLADWGVTLSADKLLRCYKLGEVAFPLQVADVTSTSDTFDSSNNSGAQLGDMAGRSVAFNGDFKFDCDTDEDGMLIVTYSILPDADIVQGIQRYWWHKTKLDFLNGDFDGLSIREIRQNELFVGTKRTSSSFASGIFGFCPAYAEYKIDYSIIDGDFAVDTKNLGLYGFELARMFSDELGDTAFNEAHGLNFVLSNDASQYNRIFFNDDESADKFVIVHRCNFEHRMPAVPLYDSYDFEDGKKNVIMTVNGAKDN